MNFFLFSQESGAPSYLLASPGGEGSGSVRSLAGPLALCWSASYMQMSQRAWLRPPSLRLHTFLAYLCLLRKGPPPQVPTGPLLVPGQRFSFPPQHLRHLLVFT